MASKTIEVSSGSQLTRGSASASLCPRGPGSAGSSGTLSVYRGIL